MSKYIAIGVSPWTDSTVAIGPFTTQTRALEGSGELDEKGYVTEIIELSDPDEIPNVANDEGAGS